MVGNAAERLRISGVRRLIATDSMPIQGSSSPPLKLVSVAPLLADCINRLAQNMSLSDLVVRS